MTLRVECVCICVLPASAVMLSSSFSGNVAVQSNLVLLKNEGQLLFFQCEKFTCVLCFDLRYAKINPTHHRNTKMMMLASMLTPLLRY